MSEDQSHISELRKCKALLLAMTEYAHSLDVPKILPNTVWICEAKKELICIKSGKPIQLNRIGRTCTICSKHYTKCYDCCRTPQDYEYGRCQSCGFMICYNCSNDNDYECVYCGDVFCDIHLNKFECTKCSSPIRVCTPDINFRPSLCAVCSNEAELLK